MEQVPLETITDSDAYRRLEAEVNDCVFVSFLIFLDRLLLLLYLFSNFHGSTRHLAKESQTRYEE